MKNKGKRSYTIRLVKKKDRLIIIKKVYNTKIFEEEKKFYETYKDNPSRIKLPSCVFKKNNTMELEFIKSKSFMRLIVDGSFGFDTVLKQYKTIKKEIKLFYGKEFTLIHGDFWLTNIFVDNNKYYLIDFSESFKSNFHFDLYILLYSILSTFRVIDEEEKTITHRGLPFLKLLDSSSENIKKFENKFISSRKIFRS